MKLYLSIISLCRIFNVINFFFLNFDQLQRDLKKNSFFHKLKSGLVIISLQQKISVHVRKVISRVHIRKVISRDFIKF